MKIFIVILSILAISCSSIQTRGSSRNADKRSSKSNKVEIKEIEINEDDILVDSLGFDRAYVKTLSSRQKNYLLEEYGYDEDRINSMRRVEITRQDTSSKEDIYYRDRYQTTEVTQKSYELYESEIKGGMNKFFDIALENYDSGNIKKAKNIFSFMKESLLEDDPLWFESAYYYGECLIAENNFKSSLNVFLEILAKNDIPDFVNERSLVRTGQVYCVLNDDKKAFNYFLKLRNKYPRSQYLEVADCSKIN